MKLAKHDRRGHAQVPPGFPILAARRAFGFREGVEDAPRCGYKNLAGFRNLTPSRVSRSDIRRVTVGRGVDRARDAAERLPPSTAASRVRMASKRSI
jgi:hypothetical protein